MPKLLAVLVTTLFSLLCTTVHGQSTISFGLPDQNIKLRFFETINPAFDQQDYKITVSTGYTSGTGLRKEIRNTYARIGFGFGKEERRQCLGLFVRSQQDGPLITNSTIQAKYSTQITIDEDLNLSFGLSSGGFQHSTGATAKYGGDVFWTIDGQAGVLLNWRKANFLGLSIDQLYNSRIGSSTIETRLSRRLLVHASREVNFSSWKHHVMIWTRHRYFGNTVLGVYGRSIYQDIGLLSFGFDTNQQLITALGVTNWRVRGNTFVEALVGYKVRLNSQGMNFNDIELLLRYTWN